MGTKVKKNWILILIFLLALFFRLWKLETYPEAIDEDEMALGYYGYSLSNFGVDEYGNKFPIYFKSVGDYKYGLYSYAVAPIVKIFGLNTFTTRFPSAVFGALSIIAIYFLALTIFNNKTYALASSFVLAINPTHIHFSRVSYGNIMGAFFTVLAITFFLKFIKSKNIRNFILTLVPFVLAIFSYQAYRILIPVIFLTLTIILYRQFSKKLLMLLGIVLTTVIISFVPVESRARSQSILTIIDKPALFENAAEDNSAGTNLLLTRIIHNKITSFSLDFANRYFSYFDPSFLFLETSITSERHSIPKVGLIFLIELPILLISIYAFSKLKKNKLILVPFIMLFSAPLASATIVGVRSITRSVFLVYALSLIIGVGFGFLFEQKKFKKYVIGILAFLYVGNFIFFFHQYTVHKIYHHPWNNDVGLKEMVLSINKTYKDRYQKIVVSRGHYVPFLFYGKENPNDFINKKGIFEKLIFNMPYDCPPTGQKNTLYVCFGYKVPKAGRIIEVFRYKDGLPAIILVDFNEKQFGPLPKRLEWNEEPSKINLNGNYWPEN
ncbi:hypothetical protein A2422_02605 [Candidatus Woesebacteria bacterium RIFOXYC1_FULL_31_51]|uniref:ArnT-like N-terminal domain-containing protein n=1 Tax=Candidatus Woesebacteria bacterium GW2011_GWC2_31_9 TaxID=1618586 RepID=A0A0F9YIK7_9BACT|nr:MAG: glycosyl transferase [Candidatus Woesebacteria bacterium GW2011_GWF1_31_35]KKP23477.1 MAG: hypothetical protein UR11_C0001G0451 [Candidatus Woesebacteria bacterium GW2011_GWC1_30_29]KKP26454.1 MAG: hypothetical protein UR13_C0004G0068 [Candidatus Woesebacteria bacterium GW2011_GWD1_31_12]KKP27753.1 MAG: hypothetical protein UR16_C0002G0083 [Candidatus Woesebacteria bacterium GW2011_GWB1_31_29]KKP31369.1 MAG: hypothetical protein UR21_C0010G0011 [Candidatus Woesebacteria bacterium GW2011